MTKISSSPAVVNDVNGPCSTGTTSTSRFVHRLLAWCQRKREPVGDPSPGVRRHEVEQPPTPVAPRMGPTRVTMPAATPTPSAGTRAGKQAEKQAGKAPGSVPREEGPGWAEARAAIARWIVGADATHAPRSPSGVMAAEAFKDLSHTLSRIAARPPRPAWKRWLLPISRDAAQVVVHELAPLTRALRRDLRAALDAVPDGAPVLKDKAMTEILRALAFRAVNAQRLGPADRDRWNTMLTDALRVRASRAGAVTGDDATALRITLEAMRDAL